MFIPKKRSKFAIVFYAIFLFSLFADSANLGDLFPNTIGLHDDDEVDLATGNTDNVTIDNIQFSLNLYHSHINATKTLNGNESGDHYYYDQDSPSLAASPTFSETYSSYFSPEENEIIQETFYTSGLYLEYRNLRI